MFITGSPVMLVRAVIRYTLKPWYSGLFITQYNNMLNGLSSVTATAF